MENEKEQKFNFEAWLTNILAIHGTPCLMLIHVKEDNTIRLLSAGTTFSMLKFIQSEAESQKIDYAG